jgi:sugar lactone lactonase YvrE
MARLLTLTALLLCSVAVSGCDLRLWLVCTVGGCAPGLDLHAPETPRDVTATLDGSVVRVTFKPSRSPDVAEYRVYRRDPGAGFATHTALRHRELTLAVTVSIPGTYTFWVTAWDADDNESLPSTYLTVTYAAPDPPAPPPPPPPPPEEEGVAPPPFMLAWGERGSGRGQFERPSEIAVRPNGNVLVVDGVLDRVQEFNSEGIWIRTFGNDGDPCLGSMEFPTGLAAAPDGTVYVSQDTPACIQRYTAAGMPDGSLQTGEIEYPSGVATDAAGNIYVTGWSDTGVAAIHKYRADGALLVRWTPPPPFERPEGIDVDAAGRIYAVSALAHRIWVFRPDGSELTAFGEFGREAGRLSQPEDIALAGSRLYVADTDNHRVQGLSTTGAFVTGFGSSGSGEGQFNHPSGIATDCHGNVYVADELNARVQKFGAPPSAPCGPAPIASAAAARPRFEARFKTTASTPGRAAGNVERGARQRGTFTLSTRDRRARAFRRGNWYALFDVSARGGVRASGTLLATARRRRICLRFTTTVTAVPTPRIRGSFSSLGSRLQLAGSFDQRLASEWVLRGTTGARRGKAARRLPSRCARVARAFKLRLR